MDVIAPRHLLAVMSSITVAGNSQILPHQPYRFGAETQGVRYRNFDKREAHLGFAKRPRFILRILRIFIQFACRPRGSF